MSRSHKLAITVTILIAGAAGIAAGWWFFGDRAGNGGTTASTDPALVPEFTLPDLAGQQRSVDEWDGKALVVNFWATWCAPCREEMPLLSDVHDEYKDRGIHVIGIALDRRDAVERFAAEVPVSYPLLIAGETGFGLMDRFGASTGGLPYTVVTDRRGRIVNAHVGRVRAEDIDELLAPVLRGDDTGS